MAFVDDDALDAEPTIGFTAADVERVLKRLVARGEWTAPEAPLDLANGVRWLPHLVATTGSAVLHIHLDGNLKPYLASRLRLAVEKGHVVHVAMPYDRLWSKETLRALARARAMVTVLDDNLE